MLRDLVEILKQEKKQNIAVYGAADGEAAFGELLANDFSVYYMDLASDHSRNEADFLDTFESADDKSVDAFILMCQLISRQDIFEEMMEYCRIHHADIYDEKGRNIYKICSAASETETVRRDTLLKAIACHECISFDIFDTLLTRTVMLPEDVFELMERRMKKSGILIENFKEKRIKAQEMSGLSNPDLMEIYKNLQNLYGITEELLETCWKMEISVEQEVLIVRKDMLDIYQMCLEMGKTVSLVSDMYIPAAVLEPILSGKGIKGYHKLYISCDYKQLKIQGLLEKYAEEVQGENYLHIGDHVIHDGICAKLAGMDYCLISHGLKLAQKTFLAKSIVRAKSLEEHIMLGMIIASIMNSPFRSYDEKGRIAILSEYEYSFNFCAALISQFALWLYWEAKKESFTNILFASRDGYLIQKMYDMLVAKKEDRDAPAGKYFYTSRKAAVMTCINNEAYINMIIDISSGMPPRKMMKERFGLPPQKILKYEKEKYSIVHPYVWAHVNAIFERADEAKLNYFKYMGNIGLQIGKKYAFMDFVSSGTSQKSLAKIAPFELKGIYAGWNSTESKDEAGIRSLFDDSSSFFMRKYKIMETFMSSPEPSLSHFDDEGNPVFEKQDRSLQELEYVGKMQEACLDYFMQMLALIDPEIENISNDFTDSIFEASEGAFINDPQSVLNHLSLMDNWRKKRNKIERLIR